MQWLGLAWPSLCLMVTAGAEIHFQKPLLYNIANNLFFDFLIYDHKQINELLVGYAANRLMIEEDLVALLL